MEAATVERFLRAPVGRYTAGRRCVVWCWSRTLCGAFLWGRPDEADVREMVRLHAICTGPGAPLTEPFDCVLDGRLIEAIDPPSFHAYVEGLAPILPELTHRIRRQAMLPPVGLPGTIVAGFIPIHGATAIVHQLFTDLSGAFAWFARDDGEAARVEVERLVEATTSAPPAVRDLRRYLEGALRDATLVDAARALGVSVRTLQRQLLDSSTSFRVELVQARLRTARALLADTDLKLEAIVHQVGAASLSHFSMMFRRDTGESPSEFRERHRAARSPGDRSDDQV
jgi:AraC-like DNA-binding protein